MIYFVVLVVVILALAGLFGIEPNQAVIGTLVAFATGTIGGILTYLRLSARAASGRKEKPGGDEEKHEAE